jgi:pyruvate formate-lyase/glycerol dehydratase family glycyl radical enzyme
MDDDTKKDFKEIYDYWKSRNLRSRKAAVLHEYTKNDLWGRYGGNDGNSLAATNHRRLVELGLNKIMEQTRERLEKLDEDEWDKPNYHKKRPFLQSVIIACEAAINFTRRYADKARELAGEETDIERKAELERIADICEWVPANPPRTFHEALQTVYFAHIITAQIEYPMLGFGMRMDQDLYPFYKRDLEKGILTREQAQELLECLWIKFEELGRIREEEYIKTLHMGSTLFQSVNIGGVTKEGEDATNELSFVIIDAQKSMQTRQPNMILRYHDRMSSEFLLKSLELVKTGIGMPSFFNDKVAIPHLLSSGIPIEECRDYVISACNGLGIYGKPQKRFVILMLLNTAGCLELSLNRIHDEIKKGERESPSSIEEIKNGFRQEIAKWLRKAGQARSVAQALYAEHMPRPFFSALFKECIDRAEDAMWWEYPGARPYVDVIGTTNVADSLAAIKKFVFEEKSITLGDLIEAVRSNFEGNEELRLRLVNEAPKFGNDNDYVDLIAKEVNNIVVEELGRIHDDFGNPHVFDGAAVAAYYLVGSRTGATPDGRKAHEPLADASDSPQAGLDKNGPTAALKSISKIDHLKVGQTLLNQRFNPATISDGLERKFLAYIRTWADLGIFHIQFNTVSSEMLTEAQNQPEKYQDLVVRVAGYSAYFTQLAKGVQDSIIERTAQAA